MAAIEVGIRIDMTSGVSFFGLEAVNKQLATGLKIREPATRWRDRFEGVR